MEESKADACPDDCPLQGGAAKSHGYFTVAFMILVAEIQAPSLFIIVG